MSTENPNSIVNEQGVLLKDMTISGVAYAKGMTAAQREQAVANAATAGTYQPSRSISGPPVGWQTRETEQRLAQGDASSKAPSHAALDQTYAAAVANLRQQNLPETQFTARYGALKREYEKQLNGIFAAEMQRVKAPPA